MHELEVIQKEEQELIIRKQAALIKAMKSNDPQDIVTAQKVLKDIEERQDSGRKIALFDPNDYNQQNGYMNRPISLSYDTLRAMSKVHIISLIIQTRINQVAAFCEPQRDKYNTGFVIKKKKHFFEDKKELTRQDEMKIEALTEFVLNCGSHNQFDYDDFDGFSRKVIRDSLTFDQLCFEVPRSRKGLPFEFLAVDAGTIRIAETYDNERIDLRQKEIKGYLPKYVQVINEKIEAEFYPWELCMGIRNPISDIKHNGYGYSELEMLISTVTSILWADQYNRNFFNQGAAPKGILKVNGQLSSQKIKEFKQMWQSTVAGVENSWKTPMLEADKVDWIDLQRSNKDMEWSNWIEFLIKISTGCYSIDPSEINFPMNNGGTAPMFEKNNEAQIKYSKDKGLYPLLKHYQSRINKYVIKPLAPDFEFTFVGLDAMTIQEEIDLLIKKAGSYMTINEIRREVGLEDIGEEGDIIANSVYMQNLQMKSQEAMMGDSNEAMVEDEMQPSATDVDFENSETENPFVKGIENFLNEIK